MSREQASEDHNDLLTALLREAAGYLAWVEGYDALIERIREAIGE